MLPPMMTVCPMVSDLKRGRSPGIWQRSCPWRPMARSSATAAMADSCIVFLFFSLKLDGYLSFDGRVRLVILEREVVVVEVKDRFDIRVDAHRGEWVWCSGQLKPNLLQMVEVDVRVARCMDKVAGLETCNLRHHHGQEGVGGDVERNAKETVGGTLVKLKGQATIGNIELEEHMARRKVHVGEVSDVPSVDDDTAGVGVVFYVVNGICYLVDESSIVVGPMAPLVAVDVSEVARGWVSPFVPDANSVFLQVAHVGVSVEEPKQFVDDGFEVNFFGGDDGEALA